VIVCYAPGGGLGHLTRVRAALHTAYRGRPATIVTDSPHAADPRVVGPFPVVRPPAGADPSTLSAWLGATLRALNPSELVVDAFPAGLRGELTATVVPPTVGTVTHLARLLRWESYGRVLPAEPVHFDRTWFVEPLTAEHGARVAALSSTVDALDLVDPEPAVDPDPDGRAAGAWLVVHAGPAAEVAQLLRYAEETAALEGVRPRLLLVSPVAVGAVPRWDAYPAWPLFRGAERIVTAAGYNAVRQAAPWRERHRMVPFPRRFDDQFARAARARA
jgi:hypothetical protein